MNKIFPLLCVISFCACSTTQNKHFTVDRDLEYNKLFSKRKDVFTNTNGMDVLIHEILQREEINDEIFTKAINIFYELDKDLFFLMEKIHIENILISEFEVLDKLDSCIEPKICISEAPLLLQKIQEIKNNYPFCIITDLLQSESIEIYDAKINYYAGGNL